MNRREHGNLEQWLSRNSNLPTNKRYRWFDIQKNKWEDIIHFKKVKFEDSGYHETLMRSSHYDYLRDERGDGIKDYIILGEHSKLEKIINVIRLIEFQR